MKVFMSWSGNRSRAVAQLLGDWLQDVIQAVKPWISTEGIEQGEQWFSRIGSNLGEVNIGIVCLTPENKEAPWLMFEAGALSKGLTDSRIMTFLIDLKHQDIRPPLAQFHHTVPTKQDMFKLVNTLNHRLGDAALPASRLESGFNTYWPQFEEKYNKIMAEYIPEAPPQARPEGEILSEVLETVRSMKQQLRVMEVRTAGQTSPRVRNALLDPNFLHQLEAYAIDGLSKGKSVQEILDEAPDHGFPQGLTSRRYLVKVLDNFSAKDDQEVLRSAFSDEFLNMKRWGKPNQE